MAWPPQLPPATRQDSTPQATNHPDDHNQIAAALAEIVAAVTPQGVWSTSADVTWNASTAASNVYSSNFPAGTFSATPIIVATIQNSSGSTADFVVRITAASSTSFSLIVTKAAGATLGAGSYRVNVIAHGPRG